MSLTFPHFIRIRNACALALRVLCGVALGACALPTHAQSSQDPIYIFHTNLGDMRVQLYPDVTPQTVANFLSYVNSGAYNSSFIHRSATTQNGAQFVIQGGGYTVDANAQISAIVANSPVNGEAHISNMRGTIAMALSTGPNSGTDEWFFNEVDNSALLDGTQDGGPFTVFGKIVDSASLAVMDEIGTLPTYDASSYFSNNALTDLPLYNYQSSSNVAFSNFVVVSSITPAWTATAVAAGPDGKTRILWNRADGAATLWTLNADGSAASYSPTFGPIAGWSATHISVGADNGTRILWNNTDGRMTLWTLPAGSSTPSYGTLYGPYAGWSATGIATDTNNATHILWDNTNGTMTLWSLPASGSPSYSPEFGPITGWTAKSIATGSDSSVHVLWNNADGRMTLWTVAASGTASYGAVYGPLTGWTATSLSVDTAGAGHVLWDNVNGTMTLWTIPSTGSPTYSPSFGPYAGFSAVGLSVGAGGNSHVLWDNVNGTMTPWTLSTSSQFVGSFPAYGPY